ncbi:cytoplasmic protein [Streptococcus mutans LP13]|nr:cytoplasmic protein [Streptococcus mutans LP13]
MTPQELWNQYKRVNPNIGDSIDAWQFGAEPDQLAQLVLK